MTPLFACFPVCLTFVSIAIIGVIVVVFDMANRVSTDEPPEPADGAPAASTPQSAAGLPPLWVFPVTLLVLAVLLLVLAWYWPE
jgi:hypothetical protein